MDRKNDQYIIYKTITELYLENKLLKEEIEELKKDIGYWMEKFINKDKDEKECQMIN